MNLIRTLADYVLPARCHICGEKLNYSERYVCTACCSRLPRTNYHRRGHNPMEIRFDGIVNYCRASGFLFYAPHSDVAIVIQDLKYNRFRGLARYMGEMAARELMSTGFFSDVDVIVPIPMHFWKQAKRGYNQCEQIAKGISNVTRIEIDTSLRAVRPHRSQTSFSHRERLNNVRGVFELRNDTTLRGKHILLVDDVCTTGSTLSEAAAAICRKIPDATFSMLTLGVTF